MNEESKFNFRKEVGIGLYPFKNLTIRTAYSNDVGITVTAGYRIPIDKKKKKFNPKKSKHELPAYFRNLN